jgi:hypothetical protein
MTAVSLKNLSLLIISLTSFACAKGGGSGGIVGDPNLAFTWESECLKDDAGRNFIMIMENTKKESKRTTTYFYDAKCDSASTSDVWMTEYALGDRFTNAPDVYRINFTIKTVEKTYTNDAEINTANAISAYGFDDWATNEAKDVTGKKLAPTESFAEPEADQVEYQIFKVEDDLITLGDISVVDADSEETRPTKLSSYLVLQKQ